MLSSGRASLGRLASRLTKEGLRAELLQALPELAYDVGAQRENPARVASHATLSELLNKITEVLSVHSPEELVRAACQQLGEVCKAAEQSGRTFEASVKNVKELASAKIHVAVLGAAGEEDSRSTLDEVRSVASEGGIVRKLAAEALWLSTLVELLQDRRDPSISEALSRTALPTISSDTFQKIQQHAKAIVSARDELFCEPQLTIPRTIVAVRNPQRDRDRESILNEIASAGSSRQKIQSLKRLRRDAHVDARDFLLGRVQDTHEDTHLREVCCCLLEEIAEEVSLSEANDIARHLLARLTQHIVSRRFTVTDLSLLLRLIDRFGDLDASAVLTQLLEDEQLATATRGTDQEVAVLLLVLSLLGRGGTSSRCLERLVLGIGLEHLAAECAVLIRTKAVRALAGQSGGIPKLIQLLEFYRYEPVDDPTAIEICSRLSQDDGVQKVEYLLEILQEIHEAYDVRHRSHAQRVVQSLRNTRNPRAFSVLIKVMLDRELAFEIRQEASLALRHLRGEGVLVLTSAYEKGTAVERGLIMRALSGEVDEARMQIMQIALSRSLDATAGVAELAEKLEALVTAQRWRIV
jgi:hypothetical protein